MALPEPTNCTVDIYRGFDPAKPYPKVTAQAAVAQTPGIIKHHVKNGRFGYKALNLHWTHVLWLPSTKDVRDIYNSQIDQAFNIARADTVTIADYPLAGWCTAFVVVFVQLVGRGTAFEFYKVYLDRVQPVNGPCQQGNLPVGINTNCCPNPIPTVLTATLTNVTGCALLDGLTFAITYNGSGLWVNEVNIPGFTDPNGRPQTFFMEWWCNNVFFTFNRLGIRWTSNNGGTPAFAAYQVAFPYQPDAAPYSCSPVNVLYSQIDLAQVPPAEAAACTGRIKVAITYP